MAVVIDQEKCTGCEACVKVCHTGSLKVVDGKARVSDDCAECGTCIDECPAKAIAQP